MMTTKLLRTRPLRAVVRLGVVALVCVTLSGCLTLTTNTNKIHTYQDIFNNWRVEVYFRRAATNDIVDGLHYGHHGGNARKTLAVMDDYRTSAGFRNALEGTVMVLSDISFFFDRVQAEDFAESAAQTRNNTNCIVMHRVWISAGDRHNWTERNAGGHCDIGSHFKL